MAQLNNITVIPRHNRPSTEERVELQMHYIVGGSLYDPYEIETVHIFKDTTASSAEFPYITNGISENLIDLAASSVNYGLIATSALDYSVFRYGFDTATYVSSLDTSSYSLDASAASGIYRGQGYSEGVFSVVVAPSISGTETDGSPRTIAASGLQSGDYFDIWTVRHREDGSKRTFIQQFTLNLDSVIILSEPLILDSSIELKQRYVQLGSKEDLRFEVRYGVANRSMSRAEKNIFRETLLRNAAIRITKLNEETNLDSRYEVSGFSDTSGVVRVTSTDDVLFNFDTTKLTAIANATTAYGTVAGVYELQLEFTLLTETIRSPRFKVILK